MAEFNIPGVYSKVDASAAVQAISANDSVIGVIATAESGEFNKPYAPYSFDDVKQKYGENSNIAKLIAVAMTNGGNKFIVVRVDDTETEPDYQSALDAIELEEAVNIVITDTMDSTDHAKIRLHVESASENRRERIAFLGVDAGTDITSVIEHASQLNSGRIFIPYPNPLNEDGEELEGIYGAAALAGIVAAEFDPSLPFNNVEVRGFYGLGKKMRDSEFNALIEGGVLPLDVRNGTIRIVRGVSTYTKDATGTPDITWQEITVTRISDYVMKDIRSGLTRKFSRAKQNQRTRDSVKSEVLTRLKTYESLEYLENVSNNDVSIQINPTDPFRSDVIFKYDVVGPMNVIHLTGHLVI